MHTTTLWVNCEGDFLSCISHRSREEADQHAHIMSEKYNDRRTACLKLVISWEDGDGIDFPAMELQHVQD